MRRLIDDVDAAGGLRADLPHDVAADTVWATNSPELYPMLTEERGWTADAHRRWLSDLWASYLLPVGPERSSSSASHRQP